jgi:hypothetical protein
MAVDPDGSGSPLDHQQSAIRLGKRSTERPLGTRRTHKAHLTRRPQAPEQWSRSVVDKDRHLRRFDHCRAVLQRPTSSDAEPPFSGSSLMSRHRASHDQAGRYNETARGRRLQRWPILANNSGSLNNRQNTPGLLSKAHQFISVLAGSLRPAYGLDSVRTLMANPNAGAYR